MPILIEDMEAEVRPEREQEAPAPRTEPSERQAQALLAERVLRSLRIRDERDARWCAD